MDGGDDLVERMGGDKGAVQLPAILINPDLMVIWFLRHLFDVAFVCSIYLFSEILTYFKQVFAQVTNPSKENWL